MKLRTVSFFFLVVYTGVLSSAQDAELSTVLAGYELRRAAIRSDVTTELKQQMQSAEKGGNLDRVEELETQLKEWSDARIFPSDKNLTPQASQYQEKMQTLRTEVERAYDGAISRLTKSSQLEAAKNVRRDKESFLTIYAANESEMPLKEGKTRVDLASIPGMHLAARYNNPRLDVIYETWSYSLPKEHSHNRIKLIPATDGEALPSHMNSSPNQYYWYDVSIDNDGYFWLHSGNAVKDNKRNVAFQVRRRRP